jgi:hypothetical protein
MPGAWWRGLTGGRLEGRRGSRGGCLGRSVGADRRTLGGGATVEDVGCAVQGRTLAQQGRGPVEA